MHTTTHSRLLRCQMSRLHVFHGMAVPLRLKTRAMLTSYFRDHAILHEDIPSASVSDRTAESSCVQQQSQACPNTEYDDPMNCSSNCAPPASSWWDGLLPESSTLTSEGFPLAPFVFWVLAFCKGLRRMGPRFVGGK